MIFHEILSNQSTHSLFWYTKKYMLIINIIWNIHCSSDHNIFDIVDNANSYNQDDISNVNQWYFMKFYQIQSTHSLFWCTIIYLSRYINNYYYQIIIIQSITTNLLSLIMLILMLKMMYIIFIIDISWDFIKSEFT